MHDEAAVRELPKTDAIREALAYTNLLDVNGSTVLQVIDEMQAAIDAAERESAALVGVNDAFDALFLDVLRYMLEPTESNRKAVLMWKSERQPLGYMQMRAAIAAMREHHQGGGCGCSAKTPEGFGCINGVLPPDRVEDSDHD